MSNEDLKDIEGFLLDKICEVLDDSIYIDEYATGRLDALAEVYRKLTGKESKYAARIEMIMS